MKKLIIIISLTLVTIFGACTPDNDKKSASAVAFAQTKKVEGQLITDLLIEHVNGTIESEKDEENEGVWVYTSYISLPDFFDKELTTSMVYSFVGSYSDVSFFQVWQKSESHNLYTCAFIAELQPSILIVVSYNVPSNKMAISYIYD